MTDLLEYIDLFQSFMLMCQNNLCISLSESHNLASIIHRNYSIILILFTTHYSQNYVSIIDACQKAALIKRLETNATKQSKIRNVFLHNTINHTQFIKSVSVHVLFFILSHSKLEEISLEALSVDDGWARFIILLLADPHLLEG